jgi:hypothetical protein
MSNLPISDVMAKCDFIISHYSNIPKSQIGKRLYVYSELNKDITDEFFRVRHDALHNLEDSLCAPEGFIFGIPDKNNQWIQYVRQKFGVITHSYIVIDNIELYHDKKIAKQIIFEGIRRFMQLSEHLGVKTIMLDNTGLEYVSNCYVTKDVLK